MNLEKITGYSPPGHSPSSSWDTRAALLVFSPTAPPCRWSRGVRALCCCLEENLSSWKPGAGKRSFPPTGNKLMTQTCLVLEFIPRSLSYIFNYSIEVSFWFFTHHCFILFLYLLIIQERTMKCSPDTEHLAGGRGGGAVFRDTEKPQSE